MTRNDASRAADAVDPAANYLHSTPIPDEEAARLLTDQPHLQTTGWEAMLVRHVRSLEAAYTAQVEHTDFVRAKYQGRAATLEARLRDAERDTALLRLLEVTAYNLSMATLVGNPAPRVKRLYDRMSAPQVGDLVLEYSTIYHEERVGTRLGRLVRIAQEPIAAGDEWPADEPVPTERVWYIALPDGREFRWINASFLAVPTTIDRYDKPFVSDGYALATRAAPPGGAA